MRRVTPFFALALVLGLAVGCDGVSPIETAPPENAVPQAKTRMTTDPGLEIVLAGPDTVTAADSFSVQVTVKNNSDRTVVVETPNSCLIRPGIYADNERVPMKGSIIGCATVITRHEFDTGEARSRTFDMRAVRDGEEGGAPMSPGHYTIRVSLDWTIDGEMIEETLTAPFYVSSAEEPPSRTPHSPPSTSDQTAMTRGPICCL